MQNWCNIFHASTECILNKYSPVCKCFKCPLPSDRCLHAMGLFIMRKILHTAILSLTQWCCNASLKTFVHSVVSLCYATAGNGFSDKAAEPISEVVKVCLQYSWAPLFWDKRTVFVACIERCIYIEKVCWRHWLDIEVLRISIPFEQKQCQNWRWCMRVERR